ncbi:hypothetical protein PV10_06945 [Exophiala mesophila]|uniref:Uncharacterized protein n=1 Tax=Exophiala mesophila TaxID=212818 RepID=A0A0D1Z477_EXOME|nr:uncharacterized protein PV10_06945 [Exophiala mesophila]KIV89552.1 hypothetical protein PV10_06945 [Exophiala mesophila]
MFGKSSDNGDLERPTSSAAHSNNETNHSRRHKPLPEPAATASSSHSKAPPSVKRKDTFKSLGRSDTLSSKPPLVRVPSVQTRYMEMLLHLDSIPRIHNIAASLFTWIILAGFLVVPGTFNTFKDSDEFQSASEKSAIINSISNVPLLYVSASFCGSGVLGCLWLWYRWRHNYVWLINRVFLPVTLNSVAGLITTVVNVYTAQKHVWSITAKITAIVIGSCVGIGGFLFLTYNFWALRNVRKSHDSALGLDQEHEDETLVEKVKRKAHEPPLQSGSVV